MVWDKVEGFSEVVPVVRPMLKAEGFGPNRPGPPGLRPAGAHIVRPLGRCTTSTFAAFLVDRLARRQTE